MRIVVIGGGLVGSKLIADLDEGGHQTVAASPDNGVNTLTGEGLADVLAGASVVIDVSDAAIDTPTRILLASEAAAGVGHHVALYVTGTAHEELIRESSIPYSIVRATQCSDGIVGVVGRIAVGPPQNGVVDVHS